jgi:hypothetical protein
MKSTLTFIALLIALKSPLSAKIVMIDDEVYLRKDGQQIPVFVVNQLIAKEKVKKVHLFGEGRIHLISFAENGEEEKLYSVDDKGYIYSIEPYSRYRVSKIVDNEHFIFQEEPKKNFRVTSKGFFITDYR